MSMTAIMVTSQTGVFMQIAKYPAAALSCCGALLKGEQTRAEPVKAGQARELA
jgi:hypothetical protein